MSTTKFRTTAAAGLAVAAGLTVTALTAPAASAAPSCPVQHSCFWSGANYTGYKWDDGGHSTPNWGNVHYAGTTISPYRGDGSLLNVSSMVNRDPDSNVAVYYNSGYRGGCFNVGANGNVPDFSHVTRSDGGPANDRMNSHHYNQRC
jgi:hypothetical protein